MKSYWINMMKIKHKEKQILNNLEPKHSQQKIIMIIKYLLVYQKFLVLRIQEKQQHFKLKINNNKPRRIMILIRKDHNLIMQ